MRTRASRKIGDSMDLLLDTICNTFGGVLFIAILVILLLQDTSRRDGEAAESGAVTSPVEIRRLSRELSEIEAEIRRLSSIERGQRQTLSILAPDEIRELLERVAEREAERESQIEERARLEAKSADASAGIETATRSLENTQDSVLEARSRVHDLQRQLQTELAKQRAEIRTPIARPPFGRSEIQMIVQYGRLYVWHKHGRFGTRLGLNVDEFTVVESKIDGMVTVPRPSRGIPIRDDALSRQQIEERLRQFSAADSYLAFVVRPDSYESFAIVRDVVLATGFEYRLIPADSSSVYVDHGGSRSLVQ